VLIDGANIVTDSFFSNAVLAGSNITIQNSHFDRLADGGNNIDDNVLIFAPSIADGIITGTSQFSAHVTLQNVTAGSNYDKGIEGVGAWIDVNIIDCTVAAGGIGAWYGYNWPGSTSPPFGMANCTFVNTVKLGGSSPYAFIGFNQGGIITAADDATANANWGNQSYQYTNNFFIGTRVQP